MHRGRSGRFLVMLVATLVATVFIAPSAAVAAAGTGGWYWPTGTENFGHMSGWWDARGSSRHLAQDMPRACGAPVYAIGDGIVLESKYVSGYGPGGGQGGAVVILHKTATGTEFKALYGHVSDLRYSKGDTVKAGAVIAKINGSSPNHLHFGIHPGRAYPSDNNPFRGHTDGSQNPLGWVSPIAFLRANPRILPYCAPAVPTVATITTTETAPWARATGGWVYWSAKSRQAIAGTTQTADPVRFAYSISGKTMKALDASATIPATDAKRYAVSVIAGSRSSIRVKDLLPRLSLAAAPTVPAWGSTMTLSGTLTDADGHAFKGATVRIQRQSGTTWTTVATGISGTTGRWTAKYKIVRPSTLRAVFTAPKTFAPVISTKRAVYTKAALSSPTAPAGITHGRTFTVSGTMRPKHASGGVVTLQFQRLTSSGWVTALTTGTRLADAGASNAWTRATSVSRAGSWRVRAYHAADTYHIATYGPWKAFTAK